MQALRDSSTYLEPLNAFLYTVQAMPIFQTEERRSWLRSLFRYYSKFTVWFVPLLFIVFYIWISVAYAKLEEAIFTRNLERAFDLNVIQLNLLKFIGYLAMITNLLSCAVLLLTIHYAYQLAKRLQTDEEIRNKLQLNKNVTILHVTFIFASTVSTFVFYVSTQGDNSTVSQKCNLGETNYIFFALLDIFMSYNLFFVLDDDERPDIIRFGDDEDRTYAM